MRHAVHSIDWSYNPGPRRNAAGGLLRVRFDHYLRQSFVYFLFLRVTRLFQFPGVCPPIWGGTARSRWGGPHRNICGFNGDICSLPAALRSYHVLRRLREPSILHVPLSPFFMTFMYFSIGFEHPLGSLSEISCCLTRFKNRVASVSLDLITRCVCLRILQAPAFQWKVSALSSLSSMQCPLLV